MKQRSLLLVLIMIFVGTSLFAQQRKCEMAITLLSPSESLVIPAYAQYNLTVRITNNGPNDLLLGDTLWYNIPTIPLTSYNIFILQQPINVGNSEDITLATKVNANENTDDETISYYAKVVSSPDMMGAFRDTFLDNNTDINQVTFKACNPGGTSIHSVNAKDLNITIYPNPATDFIRIKATDIAATNLWITDLSGRVVLTDNVAANNDKLKDFRLDISSLTPGMYFIKMETDKGMATTKFTKQ